MKTLNPIENLITHAAKLYFELCQLAESSYHMGPHSGAKRTILLHLGQKGAVMAEDIAREYPDPTLAERGPKIVFELVQAGFVRTEYRQGCPCLALTEAGKAKVQEIIKQESILVKQLPSDLTIAELRNATRSMNAFREAMKLLREEEASISTAEKAG